MLRSLAVAALAAVVRCAAGDVDDPGVAVALSVNNLACAHFGAAEQGVLFTAVAAMLAPDAAPHATFGDAACAGKSERVHREGLLHSLGVEGPYFFPVSYTHLTLPTKA